MRLLLALIFVGYLIGVGVALAPTVREKWSTATTKDFVASVASELPYAFAWPVRAYTIVRGA